MQSHLLHSNPEVGFQRAFEQHPEVLENLSSCFECLLNYLEISKKQTNIKYTLFNHSRLDKSLDLILESLVLLEKKTQILLILYQVLSDPRVLLNTSIKNKFFRVLEIISLQLPTLKLGNRILPGVLLLRGFPMNCFGCKWAKDILSRMNEFRLDDYDHYSFNQFYHCLKREGGEFELDFLQVLEMLGDLSQKMDEQVVKKIVQEFPDLLDFIRERFKEKFTHFYQYLRIYINMNMNGKLGSILIFKEILKVVDSTCKMDSSLSK
jgi:hypothetical protein